MVPEEPAPMGSRVCPTANTPVSKVTNPSTWLGSIAFVPLFDTLSIPPLAGAVPVAHPNRKLKGPLDGGADGLNLRSLVEGDRHGGRPVNLARMSRVRTWTWEAMAKPNVLKRLYNSRL